MTKRQKYMKEYWNEHGHRVNQKGKRRKNTYRREWSKLFQLWYGDPICQVCKRKMKWFIPGSKTGRFDVVCWDHKHGENGVRSPSAWLMGHNPRVPENREAFKSFDFGILCRKCNKGLPGDVETRQNLIKYLKE